MIEPQIMSAYGIVDFYLLSPIKCHLLNMWCLIMWSLWKIRSMKL